MGRIANIKTITETVIIAGRKYTLISFDIVDMSEYEKTLFAPHMFGTLDHDLIANDGHTKRAINLLDLLAKNTPKEAIEWRAEIEQLRREYAAKIAGV